MTPWRTHAFIGTGACSKRGRPLPKQLTRPLQISRYEMGQPKAPMPRVLEESCTDSGGGTFFRSNRSSLVLAAGYRLRRASVNPNCCASDSSQLPSVDSGDGRALPDSIRWGSVSITVEDRRVDREPGAYSRLAFHLSPPRPEAVARFQASRARHYCRH
jgi:hypothetical protein